MERFCNLKLLFDYGKNSPRKVLEPVLLQMLKYQFASQGLEVRQYPLNFQTNRNEFESIRNNSVMILEINCDDDLWAIPYSLFKS